MVLTLSYLKLRQAVPWVTMNSTEETDFVGVNYDRHDWAKQEYFAEYLFQ